MTTSHEIARQLTYLARTLGAVSVRIELDPDEIDAHGIGDSGPGPTYLNGYRITLTMNGPA